MTTVTEPTICSYFTGERNARQRERIKRHVVITESGCWQWQGSVEKSWGHGKIWVSCGPRNKRKISLHRFAYQIFIGRIPEGKFILHSCDNSGCCNPEHLRPGTQSENIREMYAKGRGRLFKDKDGKVRRAGT